MERTREEQSTVKRLPQPNTKKSKQQDDKRFFSGERMYRDWERVLTAAKMTQILLKL